MHKILFFSVFWGFFAFLVSAQTDFEDQLINTADDVKIELYNDYADGLGVENSPQIYYYSQQAIRLLRRNPNGEEQARALYNLGRVSVYINNADTAINYFTRASHATFNNELRYLCSIAIGQIYEEQTEYTRAYENFNMALTYTTSAINTFATYEKIIKILRLLNRNQDALAMATKALEIPEMTSMHANIYVEQAQIAFNQRNLALAKNLWERTITNALLFNNNTSLAEAYYGLAQIAFLEKDLNTTIFQSQKALLALTSMPASSLLIDIENYLAQAYLAIEEYEQAIKMLELKNLTETALLKTTYERSAYFFKNSLETSSLSTQNRELQRQLKSRTRATYIILIVMAILLVTSFIFLQIGRKKESEELAATLAYKALARHNLETNTLQLYVSKLLATSQGQNSFGIFLISFANKNLYAEQCGNMGLDYFTIYSIEILKKIFPLAHFFIDQSREFSFALVTNCDEPEFELISTNTQETLSSQKLKWRQEYFMVKYAMKFFFCNTQELDFFDHLSEQYHFTTFK